MKGNKALKSLKNKTRKLEWEEKSMTKNARDHFELVGRGLVQEANEEGEGAERMSQGQETGQEGGFKEPFKDIQGPTGYEEVKKAMEAMKWGNVVGVDKLSLGMLKGGGEILWRNIHKILQCCWEEEFIQDEWVEGIIAPLRKGGDRTDIGNYRV